MPQKIGESLHRYKVQVLVTGSGVVHNVPLQYSIYFKQDFRISVVSEKVRTLFCKGASKHKILGV